MGWIILACAIIGFLEAGVLMRSGHDHLQEGDVTMGHHYQRDMFGI